MAMNKIGNQETRPRVARSRIRHQKRVVRIHPKIPVGLILAEQVLDHRFESVHHRFTRNSRPKPWKPFNTAQYYQPKRWTIPLCNFACAIHAQRWKHQSYGSATATAAAYAGSTDTSKIVHRAASAASGRVARSASRSPASMETSN